MGDGTVRNSTTTSEDSRRPGAPKPKGATQGGAASDVPTKTRPAEKAPHARLAPTMT